MAAATSARREAYNMCMTRGSGGFRRMASLAFMAALLAVAAPTVSRTLAVVTHGAVPTLVEMCTAAGLKLVDVSPLKGDEQAPTPSKTTMDDACGYCALAAVLPLVLVLLSGLLACPAPISSLRSCFPFLRQPRNMRGLGSQAPPIAF